MVLYSLHHALLISPHPCNISVIIIIIITINYVFLYGCNMIIYEILDVVSSYLVIGYSLKEYDSSSYMKVSDQAQGHRSRKR